jgi:hypothetical protein
MRRDLIARLRRNGAYRRVFAGPDGQIVLADLLRFCGEGGDLFVPGDPHATAHNVGRYRVAQRIKSILYYDEELIARIINTEKDHEQNQQD